MIFLQVFLAILAAFFVVRLVVWRRLRRHGMGGPGGHARRYRFFRLYRDLKLSSEQKSELRALGKELRATVGDLKGDFPEALARVLGGEVFDRLSAERLADEKVATLVRAKDKALDVLERAHKLLTPAQRARVAAF